MTKRLFFLFFSVAILLFSCTPKKQPQPDDSPIVIAVSKGKGHDSYKAYMDWLQNMDSTLLLIDLYHLPSDSVDSVLLKCDGVLLTGGPDINPLRYPYQGDTALCGTIDYYRDTVEWKALDAAMERKLPLFGICRGLQLINVYQGGSLVIDLPTERPGNTIHRCPESDTCYHRVSNSQQSPLFQITGVKEGFVNTNHHQGILELGNKLEPLANSPDSLIEAIGWTGDMDHPFMLAVQWHPERLAGKNPYSDPLGRAFLAAIYNEKKKAYDE